jgi:cold shock CspA family protein
MARAMQHPWSMITLEVSEPDIIGRVAYIEPMQQWGYLHGPAGERVYFHASNVFGGIGKLGLGLEVCYRIARGGDQLCAAQVTRCAGRFR